MNEEIDFSEYVPKYLHCSNQNYVIITDLNGFYMYVNPLFQQRFKHVTLNFIGTHSFNSICEKDHELCFNTVKLCLENPDQVFSVILRKPNYDQSELWTRWEFSVLEDKNTQQKIGIFCIGQDCTENIQTRNEIKTLKYKINHIIESISDGLYILDKDWNFILCNNTTCQILGLSKKDILSKNLWSIFPESDEYLYPKYYRKAMEQGTTEYFEEPFQDKWYGVFVYPSEEGILVLFRDITQQKQYEQELKTSQEQLKAIFHSTTDSLVFISPDFKIITFNEKAYNGAKTFYGKEMKAGEDFKQYILPGTEKNFYEAFYDALQGNFNEVIREIQTPSEKRWFKFLFIPVRDKNNQIIGVCLNSIDINQQKEYEFALKESEEKFRKLVEVALVGIMLVDKDMNIIFANKEIENIFGYTQEELIGKSTSILIPERFRKGHISMQKEYFYHVKKPIVLSNREIIGLRKDGTEIYLRAGLNLVDIKNEKITVVTFQNITELREKQIQIELQNKQIKDILWKQFHEVRGPVATMLGLCNLIEKDQEYKTEYITYLNQIAQNIDNVIQSTVKEVEKLN